MTEKPNPFLKINSVAFSKLKQKSSILKKKNFNALNRF